VFKAVKKASLHIVTGGRERTGEFFHQRLRKVPQNPSQNHGQGEKKAIGQTGASPHDFSAGVGASMTGASGSTRGQG
jgi:hypothetical protein